MIAVRSLVKDYRTAAGGVVRAVDGVSFDVAAGEPVGLLGANGAGKTTTLRILATLLRATSGSATSVCVMALAPGGCTTSRWAVKAGTGAAAMGSTAAASAMGAASALTESSDQPSNSASTDCGCTVQ